MRSEAEKIRKLEEYQKKLMDLNRSRENHATTNKISLSKQSEIQKIEAEIQNFLGTNTEKIKKDADI